MVGGMLRRSLAAFDGNGEEARTWLQEEGKGVALLCEELRRYHIRLAQKNLGLMQSREKNGQMSIIDDLRQMGDYVGSDIVERAQAVADAGARFSEKGRAELQSYLDFALQIHEGTAEAMTNRDPALAKATRKRKDEGEDIERSLRTSHLARLDAGLSESVATSTAHMDMLSGFRQIGRHHFRICRALEEFLSVPS
jgi:phosphate:Na+ symporter